MRSDVGEQIVFCCCCGRWVRTKNFNRRTGWCSWCARRYDPSRLTAILKPHT